MNRKRAQRTRVVLSWIVFIAAVGTFLALFHATVPQMQFFPALLAAHGVVLILILALTCMTGRFYCAVLCPLGIWQDIVLWVSRRRKDHRFIGTYRQEKPVLRYGILTVVALLLVVGVTSIPALLEPYSIFGRILTQVITPLYQYGFDCIGTIGMQQGWFLLEQKEIIFQGTAVLAVSTIFFIGITLTA